MKKVLITILVALLFCFSGSFILAQSYDSSNSRFTEFEKFVKNDIGVDVKVYEKDEILNLSNKLGEKSSLKEKLAKYNIKGGSVSIINKDVIPNDIQVVSFNSEDDAAKYIANYVENKQSIDLVGSDPLMALAVTSYTRNYKVLVERPTPLNRIDINTRGTYSTDIYGYSYFSSVLTPWITFSGVTTGMEVVTNSTWKSLLNGGLSAQIGGSYTKKQYLLINGVIQLYSTTRNTTKTITPTGS